MKTMKKLNVSTLVSVLLATLLLCDCTNKNKGRSYEYLAVQMSEGDSWSIIDKEGRIVVKEEYPSDSRVSPVYEGVYWVRTDGKYQLYSIDSPKKPINDNEYSQATDFAAGVAVVGNPNRQICIVNTNGKVVATLGKDIKSCNSFTNDGYAVFMTQKELYGLLDTKGNIVVPAVYEEFNTPKDGLALVRKKYDDTSSIIIDMKGKKQGEINRNKYYILNSQAGEGKILVRDADNEEGHTIVLDKTGKKIFDIKKSTENSYSNIYIDGYLVFYTSTSKKGVADEKGEVIIRPKYEGLYNFGNGIFAAMKNGKWGLVNKDDETLADFDYDDWYIRMDGNYVMKEGTSYTLITKEGKELATFDNFGQYCEPNATFIDIDKLAQAFVNKLAELEDMQTADKIANNLSLNVDSYQYEDGIFVPLNIEGDIIGNCSIRFNGSMIEQLTHQEEISDGWFTHQQTIIDGYRWSNVPVRRISGSVNVNDQVSFADLYDTILQLMAKGHKKIDEGIYIKNVKVNGKTVECHTTLSVNGGLIFEITHN